MKQDCQHDDDREFEGLLREVSPWKSTLLLVSVGAFLLFFLNRTQTQSKPFQHDDPTGQYDVLDTLNKASQDASDRVVLFLGDSVMRGHVLREHGLPSRETPAYWARLLATGSVAFYDLSLDGMLPSDMEVILSSLDAIDLNQRIEIVIELSPRYLSASYATTPTSFARPWLETLQDNKRKKDNIVTHLKRLSLVRHRLGLTPLRRQMNDPLRHPEESFLEGPRKTAADSSSLRIAQHFLESNSHKESGQIRALRRIAQALEKNKRRSLFFTTPINGEKFGLSRHPIQIAKAQLILHRQTEILTQGDPRNNTHLHVSRHFDDKTFKNSDFLDHCHLTPVGNQILAQRILASLAIPSSQPYPQATPGVIADGSKAQDGFGHNATIHSFDHGAFLTPNHVLLSEPGDDGPHLRLVNLSMSSVQTIAFESEPFKTISAIVQEKPGSALIFCSNGEILRFNLNGPQEVTKIPQKFPWREDRLVTAMRKNRIIIFGPSSKRVWSLETDTMTWNDHFQVPDHQTIRSFSVNEDDEIFVLINTIAQGPRATGLCSFQLKDFLTGDISKIKNYFGNEDKDAALAWRKIFQSKGLVQISPKEDQIPISGARQVFALNQKNRVLIEAPGFAPKSKGSLSPMIQEESFSSLWNMNAAARVAYALLWPAETGIVLDENTKRPIKPGDIVCINQETGQIFSHWQGWRQLDSTRVMRFNWIYGTPPDPESQSLTAMGHTMRHRVGSTIRVGFFGSSISGAVWPGDVIRPQGLASSMSFARSFENAYQRQNADGPFHVEGVNMSMANGDLISIYATLLDLDPQDLNIAVIVLDLASLGSPESTEKDIETIVERWPAIMRDEAQRPIIDRWAGRLPKIRIGSVKVTSRSRTQTIRDALTEITAYCQAKLIAPLFLDITAIDRITADGEKLPIYGRKEDMRVARKVLSELKIPLIKIEDLMGDQLPRLYPYNFLGDRHLRSHLIRAIGQALVSEIAPLVRSQTFLFEQNEKMKKERADGRFERHSGAQIVDGSKLTQSQAQEHGVSMASTSLRRDHGLHLIVDVRSVQVSQDPWRQALALFGLRAMGALKVNDKVWLSVVRFNQYNEYGLGVRGSKQIIATYTIAPEHVKEAAREYRALLQQENSTRPSWLQ